MYSILRIIIIILLECVRIGKFLGHIGWKLSYSPPSRINWLSLYHSISVLGLESSAVHANSMKFPAITGVGGLNVIAFGGTIN